MLMNMRRLPALIMIAVSLTATEQHVVRVSQMLPDVESIMNKTPVTSAHAGGMISVAQLPEISGQALAVFPDALVASYAAPNAVYAVATSMKNPYLLLTVSEGIAIAYLLLASQTMPDKSAPAAYLESFTKSIPLSAVSGGVATLASSASSATLLASQSVYTKPLMLGGAVAGVAVAYFSPDLSDDQKSIAYAGLVAASMPVVQDMCSAAMGYVAPVAGHKKIKQKMAAGIQSREKARAAAQTKERVSSLAVALIALGGVVTTVQAYQEGTLSPQTQLIAGITLSTAVDIARQAVVYEYGSRAAQKAVTVGSTIVTHLIAEPATTYGRRVIDGLFNAFGWGKQ